MSMSRKPLSVFQHHILHVVANLKTPYGLGIKRALDGDYDCGINTGQGYQNCETLVEEEDVKKSEVDKQIVYTNTDAVIAIKTRHHWQRTQAKRRIQIEALQADSRLQH